MAPVLDFNDYTVAWIAPLDIELKAALQMLDKIHDGNFRSDPGDDYQYIAGEINRHNIIIATFPPGTQYGGVSAAALTAQVKKCMPRLWLGFLVGIAAGVPNLHSDPPRDIRLGDVLISWPDKESSGVIQLDIGKQTPEGFENISDQQKTSSFIHSSLQRMRQLAEVRPPETPQMFMEHLKRLQNATDGDGKRLFEYPGQDKDQLYQTVVPEEEDEIAKEKLVRRNPRDDLLRTRVWYGRIGSSNTVMKSRKERDEWRKEHNIIGLEMEAHGTMNIIPVGNIRGVCDYADQKKRKEWQGYAAAVAAAYTREVLYNINPTAEQRGPF
jgi:nucleoside phosphorylase